METILKPGFQRINKSILKGETTCNSINFNPSDLQPQQKARATIPKLDPGLSIIAETMCLVFNFKNSNTKSRFLNN